MAWTYQMTLTKRVCQVYRDHSLNWIKQSLADKGFMAVAFRPARAGEKYLTTVTLNVIDVTGGDFPVDMPRLIVVPAVPIFDLDKEWNS